MTCVRGSAGEPTRAADDTDGEAPPTAVDEDDPLKCGTLEAAGGSTAAGLPTPTSVSSSVSFAAVASETLASEAVVSGTVVSETVAPDTLMSESSFELKDESGDDHEDEDEPTEVFGPESFTETGEVLDAGFDSPRATWDQSRLTDE